MYTPDTAPPRVFHSVADIEDKGPPLYDDKDLANCEEFFEKHNFLHGSNYIVVGKTSSQYYSAVCHASIASNSVHNPVLVATESGFNRRRETHKYSKESVEKFERFFDYLVNRSYFRSLIVNIDDKETIRNKGFIVRTDVPAAIMQNFMIASRNLYEQRISCYVLFCYMVDKGVPEDIAFNISSSSAHASNIEEGVTFDNIADKAVSSVLTHRAHGCFDLEAVRNSRVGLFPRPFTGTYAEGLKSYNGGQRCFNEEKRGPIINFGKELIANDEEFRKILSAFRKAGQGGVYRPPNPFVRPDSSKNTRPSEISFRELIEVAVPYCIEKGLFDYVEENRQQRVA